MTSDQPSGEGSGPVLPRDVVFLKKTDLTKNLLIREVHSNVSSDIIQITEDKALICLMKNFEQLRKRDAWQVPAGILATLLTVMVTAAPTEKLGFSKETWTAIGSVTTLATAIWLIRDLLRLVAGKQVDPQTIVKELKTITADTSKGSN
jgi:hypothetical protein